MLVRALCPEAGTRRKKEKTDASLIPRNVNDLIRITVFFGRIGAARKSLMLNILVLTVRSRREGDCTWGTRMARALLRVSRHLRLL